MHQFLKFIYCGITLYMFRTVFPSIMSSRLYIQQQVYVRQVLWLLASKQVAVSDIYLLLDVHS